MAQDEWYTPPELIEDVRNFLGSIELDPTSSQAAQKVVQADRFWNKEDDCLSQDTWDADTVFMNPPYSRAAGTAGPYCEKMIEQWDDGHIEEGIILLNVGTANRWWQQLWRFPICFVSPRIKYLDEDLNKQSSPRYDNAFVFLPRSGDPSSGYNYRVAEFADAFDEWGTTMVPVLK